MEEKIIRLEIINFDCLENKRPEYVAEERYFRGNEKLSAHSVCSNYIRALKIELYLGYNNKVYPRFKVTELIVDGWEDFIFE